MLTVKSHGWYDLLPFRFDPETRHLEYVFFDPATKMVIHTTIRESEGGLGIVLDAAVSDSSPIVESVRHILRLDEPIDGFHIKASCSERLSWVTRFSAGRLLRSATVFEDLVKTLCTTNCSWGATRGMVSRLVNELGISSKSGSKAFPTAESLAENGEQYYRDVIRTGYRSPYLAGLARAVAEGKLDPESWLDPEMPLADVRKQIKSVKGFGEYAADNLMKLLGRYDGLALDSWLRSQFYKKHNRGKACPDKKIERFYAEFGEWKGLAIWCDLTADWHGHG